jgi:ATP-binding cassette subfamily B protein
VGVSPVIDGSATHTGGAITNESPSPPSQARQGFRVQRASAGLEGRLDQVGVLGQRVVRVIGVQQELTAASDAGRPTREPRRPAGLAGLRRLLAPVAEGGGLVAPAPPLEFREVFRRFWPDARPYRGVFALTLVFAALAPLVEAAQIWLFKHVVDDVLVPRDFGPFAWIAAMFLALVLLDGLIGFADDYLSTWVGERFLLRLRVRVFAHLQHLSMGFFETRRLGDVLSRLTGDVAAIEGLVLSGVADALALTLSLVVFAGALFVLSWKLAAVSLVVLPLFWLVARRFTRLIRAASREKRRRTGSIGAVAEESLAHAALVQAYNRQDDEIARFERESQGALAAQLAATRIKALFTPLVDLIELLGALIVIGLGTWLLARGDLTLGGLLAFLTFLGGMYRPIRRLSRLSGTFFAASAAAERVLELLDEVPAAPERARPVALRHARGEVAFDDVSFRYPGTAADALRGVSLRASPGETVALVGASGAGKSTVAKLLLRFYDPTAGTVRLDGHDLRALALADLREQVAVVLQETLVLHGTVRENIAYGRPGASDAEIEAAARAADAHEFIAALPDGYDTVVGHRGRRLSGGQRQRLAIARAMVRDAPVLVLDEPTTGIDAESSERILAPLRRLMAGRTTIVISHDLLTVREATEIVVLDAGRVAERGSHDELLAAGGAYARLHELAGRPA